MTTLRCLLLSFVWLFIPIVQLFPQTGDLPRVSPESQGVYSSDIETYFNAMLSCPTGEPHGIMVLRHGKVIGELFPKPFDASYPQMLYSDAKSFVGLAVVLAIEEKRLRLTDRVAPFFPDLLPDSISDNLASMTLRDLLTMTSGIQPDPADAHDGGGLDTTIPRQTGRETWRDLPLRLHVLLPAFRHRATGDGTETVGLPAP